MQRRHGVFAWITLCMFVLGCAGLTEAQVNTGALSGVITDPQGLAVRGAKLTLTNAGTGAERAVESDEAGRYRVVGLSPGKYKLSVDGGASFSVYQNDSVVVTVGSDATFDVRLELKGMQQSVTVTTETSAIETTKTDVSQTVGEQRINNLPINGRNYINFTLTNSQVNRDVAPTIGPAPTSGLNFGGQRARSNEVSVDGADAVDNSINGIRATVSQEAVQEFQLILGDYNAEYGRATGGVVNIVTKSGGNEFHGDIFGYFRNKAFQARNAFSGQVDPTTGTLDPTKQAYTRVQAGLTLGGALKKDKTFYFFSYEDTLREETGFSSIGLAQGGGGPWGMINVPLPTPGGVANVQLTPSQAASVSTLLNSGILPFQQLAVSYGLLMGSASSVALNRLDFGAVATSFGLNPGPGAHFPVPVTCPVGVTIGTVACPSTPIAPGFNYAFGMVALPQSYQALNQLRGNFPVTEKTSLWSLRLDQKWSSQNNSFLRVGVSPSLVTGIESTAQNQTFGENAGSRTGLNQSRDLDIVFQHDTILSATGFNEFRAQVARRGLHFGFSQLPGGSNIGVNIPGFAYFGREPYSTVDRIERRFEFTDHVSLIRGNHTFKMGGDYNLIQLRSGKAQIFELDYGGVVNFGGLATSTVTGGAFPDSVTLPSGQVVQLFGTTGLQSYGLGIPTTYIQGIGQSNQPFDNFPIGLFFQDSWRANRHLTFNYGVRYDVEITPLFSPLNAFNGAAEKALGVQEGIPRDYNNVAPRFGVAWDPKGDGKTVIRAGFGLFYDHPLLAIAFDSATADGGRSVQLITAGGGSSACGVLPLGSSPPGYPTCGSSVTGNALDGPTNLNGSTLFQGALNQLPNMFYLPNQQRFDPLAAGSLFANQNYIAAGFPLPILPFVLPVARNFEFGVAQQANLTIERQIAGSWKISVGYQYTKGQHLNRPVDVNSTDPQLLTQNFADCVVSGLTTCSSSPVSITVPAGQVTTATGCTFTPTVPSLVGTLSNCPGPLAGLNGTPVGTAAAFNFFRPSGPNPSFAGPNAALYPLLAGVAGASCFPAGFFGAGSPKKCYPTGFGAPVAFNSVDAQLSDGNSVYHGLTVNVQKRFSHAFEMLSSYTWSHAIDDSTDLQSPLEPQDSRFPFFERSNSDFDQRHRWVTSAVFQSPSARSGDGAWKFFVGDFTLSPIIEVSSGRPYTIITGTDYRLDLGASNGRPSIITSGSGTTSQFIPGKTFVVPTTCLTNSGQAFVIPGITPPFGCDGNLGRNPFVTPGFFQFDLRLSRRFNLGEHLKFDVIADGFNLTNRLNVAAVNQLCDPGAGATCSAGQPTAAYDARQFQFALKLSW
ncbi:MAG TPA: carboxypeptidase regulatory-like domain-containing protein [Candidatus Acidoferrum sp.]|nr:carboxypeptidase regulatory-like domain-containing protein [Candidatus Acidoferrum sp.]